jgi:hypothetical protein
MLLSGRQRQRGQVMAFAAIGMVALVGSVAIVVDNGMFLVAQRQLQAAADAGALAGAWHEPVCQPLDPSTPDPPWPVSGCQATPASPYVADPSVPVRCPGTPGYAACDVAQANADTVRALCGGTVPPPLISYGTPLNRPARVNTIVVTVECDAGYAFGRILNLTTRHISASAAAGWGNRDATNTTTCISSPRLSNGGDLADFTSGPTPPPCGRIARLIE